MSIRRVYNSVYIPALALSRLLLEQNDVVSKVNGGSTEDEEGRSFQIGPFWESKIFKEGG